MGKLSPEGYYRDSFNCDALFDVLLDPLSPGGDMKYKTAVYDWRTETAVEMEFSYATDDAILIMEGLFLLRQEVRDYWDLKIYVHVDSQVSLERACIRDTEIFGGEAAVRERYEKRYIPGQKLYFEDAKPQEFADIVIDNNDYENPKILKK